MSELIAVSKDGEYLEVHPTALKQHIALGWKECHKQEAEKQESTQDESIAVEPKKRGRPAKE